MQTKILAPERAKRGWAFRGRPRGRFHSHADTRLLEYLALISVTHGIDSEEFFGKLVEAWENQESKVEKLTITCRTRTRKNSIFLITTDNKVVAQFPIPKHLLEETDPLREFGYVLEHARRPAKTCKSAHTCLRIEDLKAGMNHVDVKARVLEIPESRMVYTRFGTTAFVSNALITDETGSMRMSLWNQQINIISKGDLVHVKNGKIASFRGELQLRIARNGSVNVIV